MVANPWVSTLVVFFVITVLLNVGRGSGMRPHEEHLLQLLCRAVV
jgi:hypothetical protein